jgi:hypothetical protein
MDRSVPMDSSLSQSYYLETPRDTEYAKAGTFCPTGHGVPLSYEDKGSGPLSYPTLPICSIMEKATNSKNMGEMI